MSKMLLVLSAAAILCGVLAEPPVDRSYLPPGFSLEGRPSPVYGAPVRGGAGGRLEGGSGRFGGVSRGSAPSSRYGASRGSGRFAGSSGFNTPSSQYNAPGFGGSNSFNAPSIQYGAPGFGEYNGFNSPSTQYGAPGLGGSSGFNAPSTQYGAPNAGGSIGRLSGTPSPVYGAPVPTGRLRGGAGSSSYSSAAAGAASRLSGGPAPVYGTPGFGGYNSALSGSTEDPLTEPANYEFQYEVQDFESGIDFGHQESRRDERAEGEYRVVLPDGRTQVVEYEANEEGYNPVIRYEETAEGAAAAERAQAIREGAAGGYSYGRGQGGPY